MTRTVVALLAFVPTLAAADTVVVGPAPAAPAPIVVVQTAPPPPAPELSRRWGVSLRAVSLSLDDNPGSDPSEFGGGGLAASYRLNRRWEFAFAMDGMHAKADAGPDLHSVTLSARFHLWPLNRWDAYLVGGLGGLHQMNADGSESSRGQVHAGVGFGYRWRRIGVAAELHAMSVGPAEQTQDATMPATTTSARIAPTAMPTASSTKDSIGGGEFTLATTLYF